MRIEPRKDQGRLQRKPDLPGKGITRFREVLLRHGLFVLMLALVCFGLPQRRAWLEWGLERFFAYPLAYFLAALCLLSFFILMTKVYDRILNTRQFLWIVYLLGVSICEEWVFRLAVPGLTAGFIGLFPAVLLCNLVFAAMHYFTLRWKIRWCAGAFLGAMGLSRLMGHGDLLLVIGVHWLATFLNTPVPVGTKDK
ncbi:MAG: CPBP family intramembrane metalloprotease [Proteobacteria bacterium]|nr:CPBP family intramembrane metalloprotease [Pseudomonadota bacterium]MBU4472045.1 CPBP family intramembrane metalloprotease [Pseudomonadota bacterium]MCG2752956.1 CPBP family intramembrane metalloprotease [Desulfobacteraceae bacterium]